MFISAFKRQYCLEQECVKELHTLCYHGEVMCIESSGDVQGLHTEGKVCKLLLVTKGRELEWKVGYAGIR